MKRLITSLLIILVLFTTSSTAQVLTSERRTDWSKAGLDTTIAYPTNQVDITSYGGTGDSVTSNNTAFNSAITALAGEPGIIYFPEGTYKFTSSISLPDGVILKGASSTQAHLIFDLSGNGDCILIQGRISQQVDSLANNAKKDSFMLTLNSGAGINTGDYIRIIFDDQSLLFSSWAYSSVGQICKVVSKAGNVLTLNAPLRMNFDTALHARVAILTPRKNVGIECLSIQRRDASAGQTTTIDVDNAVNCWVKDCDISFCNFAHIAISNSSNIVVEGCFIHEAYAYGGNGQGYGVAIQYASGECLIQNNIFRLLRHALLIQAGANGNVCAYNYCREQNRTEFPANAAGDLVLHGNYPFLNLFEGNSGQNITIDNSHGNNGPLNTFFRNRAATYGIIMSTPYSANENIVGNEITNTSTGFYITGGAGLFEYANNENGTITPTGTTPLNETSYFFTIPPDYLRNIFLPDIGIPNTTGIGMIPAETRWNSSDYVSCHPSVVTDYIVSPTPAYLSIYPNPSKDIFTIRSSEKISEVTVTSVLGTFVYQEFTSGSHIASLDMKQMPVGIYFIRVITDGGAVIKKVCKQ